LRPYLEKTHHKKRAGGVTQGVGSEFKTPVLPKKKNGHSQSKVSNTYLNVSSVCGRVPSEFGQMINSRSED
jgi:hypothetical protein